MSNLIVVAVPSEQTGVATGMNANIRTIGGSIGAAVTASIVTVRSRGRRDCHPSPATPAASPCSRRSPFVATLAVLLIPTKRRVTDTVEQAHAELALVAPARWPEVSRNDLRSCIDGPPGRAPCVRTRSATASC